MTVADQNLVERFILAEDATSAVSDGVVTDGIPAAGNHDGGRLRVGPDGKLYVGTGDARDPARSRDDDSLGGKLLVVDADGARVFAEGLRNTQGFDWLDDDTLS